MINEAETVAIRWYGIHSAQYLARDRDRMVDICTLHLSDTLPISNATARQISRQTLADIEATTAPGFIDIDRSTAHMVTLRDTAANAVHMITLPELFTLVAARNTRCAA